MFEYLSLLKRLGAIDWLGMVESSRISMSGTVSDLLEILDWEETLELVYGGL